MNGLPVSGKRNQFVLNSPTFKKLLFSQGIDMQQQSNMQNKFLIDADIGDDDVTLPSLPAVDVPIVELVQQQTPVEAPIAAVEEVSSPAVQD